MDESKLKEIKSAEKQAAEILAKAKTDYTRLINESTEEGIQMMETAKLKTRSEYQSTLLEFRKQGEKEAAGILKGLEEALAKIQKSAKLKEKAAAEYLKKSIKGKYGSR